MDTDGLNLFENLLQYDPRNRLSASNSLHHNYFKKYFPARIYKLSATSTIFEGEENEQNNNDPSQKIAMTANPGKTQKELTDASGNSRKKKGNKRRQSVIF